MFLSSARKIRRVASTLQCHHYAVDVFDMNSSSSSSARFSSGAGIRRKRQLRGTIPNPLLPSIISSGSGMADPFQHQESTTNDYLQKASLSPWVPVPDAVARTMLDMADATPSDVHVDLGCGDGRVNFHALDSYHVQSSMGVDVDAAIVEVAKTRRAKRHPVPAHLEFHVADLLADDTTTSSQHDNTGAAVIIWEKIREATILTMYFAKEALMVFRPVLERKLVGCQCRIISCGYAVPGWHAASEQVVLGMTVYRYNWGGNGNDDDDEQLLFDDTLLDVSPEAFMHGNNKRQQQNPIQNDSKFSGANVVDHTGAYPIRGYNPDIFDQVEDDEEDWDAETDDDNDEDEEDEDEENADTEVNVEKVTTKKK